MSLVQELETDETSDNRPTDELNETDSGPLTAPVFTKPAVLSKVASQPAGSKLRLRCPAKGR